MLRKTAFGKVIRAVRDSAELVSAMGVNLPRTRRAVFALGSAVSGLAAILLGLDVGIDPNIGMAAVLNGAIAVIIGGVGVFRGAVVGAFVLGILQSLVVARFSGRWADALAFVVLILFLIFRPEGVLGPSRRVEEVTR
jgi:branched-chain amino acid transport system permease protein